MDFVSRVKEALEGEKLSHSGWTALARPLSMDIYHAWLAAGRHGSMDYLRDHAPLKENPQSLSPRAQSAIVVTKRYAPTHPYPLEEKRFQALRTALYARGGDYHHFFKEELERVAKRLKDDFPWEEFLCFTDSAPILERDLAYRAGLGWIGKNSCLIHPQQGSLFFIGQILTSLPAPTNSPPPVADHCGACDRCIKACPTAAIGPDRTLDARACISYWTIEAREAAPIEIRTAVSNWFFGCDICQTVCPWNEKVFGRELMKKESDGSTTHQDALIEDLRWILNSSNREITRALGSTPLMRARPTGLKRNALIVIGNLKIQALGAEVERALSVPRLKDLAQWVKAQLNLS